MNRDVCGICWCPYDDNGACGCKSLNDALTPVRSMAQAYEAGYKAGVAHEREACERACKHQPHWVACAAAIRARGVQS